MHFYTKVSFSLLESHFPDESINLNFVLVLRYFENIAEALIRAVLEKDADSVMTPKRKNIQKRPNLTCYTIL